MKLRIDTEKLIAKFGGVSAMARYMTENGHTVPRQTISRIKKDGTIGMRFWLTLCAIELTKGNKLDLWFFVKEGK